MFQKELLLSFSVVPIYHGVTTQIIIVIIQINFHGFNQHGGVWVSELQAPVFGNVKCRMWGDEEFPNLKRVNLLATIIQILPE